MQFATTSFMDKAAPPSSLYALLPPPKLSPNPTRNLTSVSLCCSNPSTTAGTAPPVMKRRTRYRKQYLKKGLAGFQNKRRHQPNPRAFSARWNSLILLGRPK